MSSVITLGELNPESPSQISKIFDLGILRIFPMVTMVTMFPMFPTGLPYSALLRTRARIGDFLHIGKLRTEL